MEEEIKKVVNDLDRIINYIDDADDGKIDLDEIQFNLIEDRDVLKNLFQKCDLIERQVYDLIERQKVSDLIKRSFNELAKD